MLRLYDYLPSGNGYKVRLLLHQLDIACERIELDIERGATRTPEFLAMNPNGCIPLLVLEDGTALAESNAIQAYLAEGTPLFPSERVARAQTLQWMFFEQYSHEPYIAVIRHWCHTGEADAKPDEVAARRARGYEALDVMEGHLDGRDWFAAGSYSIADIALYAYTHVAHEGGFDLAPYLKVRAWLDRVRQQPRYIPITQELSR
jgi:glutathione S-transferase